MSVNLSVDHGGRFPHHHQPRVKAGDIRALLPSTAHLRNNLAALALAALSLGLYALCWTVAVAPGWWWLRLAAGVLAGAFAATAFVVAHDACHQSLSSSPRANDVLARLCFLPSYHPCAAWEHSHNSLHHGWTNVRGKDPAYPPLTRSQFDALPPWRRAGHRFCRSTLGVGFLYLSELYLPHELLPRRAALPAARWRAFVRDRRLVIAFLIMQVGAVAWLNLPGPGVSLVAAALASLVVPALVCYWLIGFATLLHHTHPRVPWFKDTHDWDYLRGQVECTVHTGFPQPVDLFFHKGMDHTAHHADPRIPLYRLHECQAALENEFGPAIVHEPFTMAGWWRMLRTCRLYDYDTHQWLDWDGTPTTDPLMRPAAGGRRALARVLIPTAAGENGGAVRQVM